MATSVRKEVIAVVDFDATSSEFCANDVRETEELLHLQVAKNPGCVSFRYEHAFAFARASKLDEYFSL